MDISIASGVIAAAGVAVGAGIAWGAVRTRQGVIVESHNKLKTDFINHKDNHKIHIDPDRDLKTVQEFRQGIKDDLAEIKTAILSIDSRFQQRIEICSDRFNKLNNRISAMTGKANGGNS